MQRQIEYSQFIKPICLFQANDLVSNINDGWIVGYGITSNFYHLLPRKLRIPIVDLKTCLAQEPRYSRLVSPRTFCAGSKICSNVCQSFLGSGFFVLHNGRLFLAGIASVTFSDGYSECDYSNYVIFTNVHLMTNWIGEKLMQKVNEVRPKSLKTQNVTKNQTTTTEMSQTTVKQEEDLDVRFTNDVNKVPISQPVKPEISNMISKAPGTLTALPTFPPVDIPTNVNSAPPSVFDDSLEDSFEPSFDPNKGNVFINQIEPIITSTSTTSKTPTFLQADCGVMSEASGLVQGGRKTEEGAFPWAAPVFRKNKLKGNLIDYSVGALISFRHVYIEALTVSFINDLKIVSTPKAEELKIIFGVDDLSLVTDETPFSEASDIIIHPDYILGIPIKANIAIIILKEPVEFSRKIFPVCLYDSPITVKDAIGKTVFGFGYGGQSDASTTSFKKYVKTQIKDQEKNCPADYKFILRSVKDKSPYFCTGGERNETICVGDSASVYIKEKGLWYIFASIAFHDISIKSKVCNGEKPAMFELLSTYVKWIQNIVITM